MRRIAFICFSLVFFVGQFSTSNAQYPRLNGDSSLISLSPDGQTYLAETDQGVLFLYDVPNRQRIDFSGEVVAYLSSINMKPRRHARPLEQDMVWSINEQKTNAIFLTLAGVGHAVVRFNANTGKQTGFYPSGLEGVTVNFKLHQQNVVVYDVNRQRGRWHRLDGSLSQDFSTRSAAGFYGIHYQFFTPDQQYFAVMSKSGDALPILEVWDTAAPQPYSSGASFTLNLNGLSHYDRVLGTLTTAAESEFGVAEFWVNGRAVWRVNLVSRTSIAVDETVQALPEQLILDLTAYPRSTCSDRYTVRVVGGQAEIVNLQTGMPTAVGDNPSEPDYIFFSPDCKTVAITQFDQSRVGIYLQTYMTTVYQTQTALTVARFPHTYRGWMLSWSPDSEYLWWVSDTEATLLEAKTLTQHSINPSAEGRGLWLKDPHHVIWDIAAGQARINFNWGEFAINLSDGSRRLPSDPTPTPTLTP